ncbi:sodium channel protein Nach-like [Aethina tumida]|uniref:sodium channel protein Nach-like n=1 Tax=Aethina tumida TaxID=116153 RepID=UPI0021488940|nr:sodium channel protein Nach-like [Aethina tumida]
MTSYSRIASIRKRFGVVKKRFNFQLQKYCKETTLHGFHYITSNSSSPLSSLIWFCICCLSLAFCLYLINLQLITYTTKRVNTNIATTVYPIYDVPFPSVTICNVNVVYKNNTGPIRKVLAGKIPEAHINDFFYNLSTLVLNDNLYGNMHAKSYEEITGLLEEAGYNTEILMQTLAQPCEAMLLRCKWNDKDTNCSSLFTHIKTTYGFCCSFNYKNVLHGNNATFSDVFVSGVGPQFGLKVSLNIDEDQYVSPIKPYHGLEVAIHEPYQFPDMVFASTTLSPGYKIALPMDPTVFSSDEDIRVIGKKNRGCIFYDERQMSWTRKYSFSSCITDYNLSKSMKKCHCLSQCNQVTYEYRTVHQYYSSPVVGYDDDSINETVLNVYFNDVACTQYKRSIYITWDSLLASIGGIFGLCMGGSIISLIEIVYFFVQLLIYRPLKNKVLNVKPNYNAQIYVAELYPSTFKK